MPIGKPSRQGPIGKNKPVIGNIGKKQGSTGDGLTTGAVGDRSRSQFPTTTTSTTVTTTSTTTTTTTT